MFTNPVNIGTFSLSSGASASDWRSGNGSDGTLWAVALAGVRAGQNGAISSLTYGVFRYAP